MTNVRSKGMAVAAARLSDTVAWLMELSVRIGIALFALTLALALLMFLLRGVAYETVELQDADAQTVNAKIARYLRVPDSARRAYLLWRNTADLSVFLRFSAPQQDAESWIDAFASVDGFQPRQPPTTHEYNAPTWFSPESIRRGRAWAKETSGVLEEVYLDEEAWTIYYVYLTS